MYIPPSSALSDSTKDASSTRKRLEGYICRVATAARKHAPISESEGMVELPWTADHDTVLAFVKSMAEADQGPASRALGLCWRAVTGVAGPSLLALALAVMTAYIYTSRAIFRYHY